MQRRIFTLTLGLVVMFVSHLAVAQYQVTNLVSNQVSWAKHPDPLSANAWGIAYGPGGPVWIADNTSGWSTLYNGSGVAKSLKVEIPTASGGGVGSPTGLVFNGSGEFPVAGWSAFFVFATLDGTISGWAPQSDLNNTIIAVNNSASGAVYTGLAITTHASGNFLYAADSANGKVDMFDANFGFVKSFTDPNVPAGFTPFGIADINGMVFVSFANPDGSLGGVVDIFQEDGTFVKTFASGFPLNQPWGFAVAPSNFGPLSNTLLISNNTNTGTINAFDMKTGKFIDTMRDKNGKQIHIDQLWAIEFGGGTANNGRKNQLFFTAGPGNNVAGLVGTISFMP